MTKVTTINLSYSTTRTVTRQQSVIEKNPDDQFETMLFFSRSKDAKVMVDYADKSTLKVAYLASRSSLMWMTISSFTTIEDSIKP